MVAGAGSLFLANLGVVGMAGSSISSSSDLDPLLQARILEPSWPGRRTNESVGYMCTAESALAMGKFYSVWYDNLICFTDGDPIQPSETTEFSDLGITFCEDQLVQINECPEWLTVSTSGQYYRLKLLYGSIARGV